MSGPGVAHWRPARPASSPLSRFTPREREVLPLLLAVRRNREIAEALSISERTVESHVASILHKLDLPSRLHLLAWAVGRGLPLTLDAEQMAAAAN